MKGIYQYLLNLLSGVLVVLLISCSGGGGGGSTSSGGGTDVTGLEVADQMALVSASISSLLKFQVPTLGNYVTDLAEVYVYDESMSVLDMINEILCKFEQTRYADLVNQGTFVALIDGNLCGHREDQSSEQSDQSSSLSQDFETWTCNSSREDNSSDEIVQCWIPAAGSSEDPFDEIRAEAVITAGKSDEHPFGIFSMNFVGYYGEVQTMTGNLSSTANADGNVEFAMVLNAGDVFSEETHAIIAPDGSSGQAYAHFIESFFDDEETINVAFNESHYLTDYGDGDAECLDRLNFDQNVWEYNLYDATGARVTRNSGVGIKYDDNQYGWAGYYGIWLDDQESTDINGLEVTSDDGEIPYTVFQGAGRLIKRTKGTLVLGDFVDDIFNMWNDEDGTNLQVKWNGTDLVKIGTETCNENGCEFEEIAEEAVTLEPNQWLGLWKQGLGNVDIVVPDNGALSNEMDVPYYAEEFVAPSDPVFADGTTLILGCYQQCPKATLSQEEVDNGDIYLDDVTEEGAEPYTYIIDSNYTLTFNDEPVVFNDGVDLSMSSNSWGMMSGAMVTSDVVLENPWEVWSQDITYGWETGPNSWNKYSGILDSNGDAVVFEAPLNCLYSDEEAGTFVLDYSGEGQLWGIPFEVETDEESGFEYWRAVFVIPDGSEVVCDGDTYYTKAMVIEQSMQEVDASECSDLTIESVGAPEDTFLDPGLDAAPEVTDAPAVIGGVLQ